MNIVAGTAKEFSEDFLTKLYRYRHKVFVERLGWRLPIRNGMEIDQFDRNDTMHFAVEDEQGSVAGYARLLPTTAPYLLQEKFPHVLSGMPPPQASDVWELSRFAVMSFHRRIAPERTMSSSAVTRRLLHEAIAHARRRGAKRLITVSPLGVERLLRKIDVRARRAASPTTVDGYPVLACWIDT
jgi:N-acyl-L-homoserine lactone synthetase